MTLEQAEQIAELIGVLRTADHQEDWKSSSEAQGRIIGEFAKLLDAADKLARLTALLEPLRPLEAAAGVTPAPWAAQFGGHHITQEGDALHDLASFDLAEDGALAAAARNAVADMLRVVGS